MSKIQHGGQPPFWKSYLHISAANCPNCTKFSIQTYFTAGDGNDKKSEIHKFMADGRGIKNHFLAITRLHIVRLRRNLEWGGAIARTRRLDDENVKFRKSNMADDRHFENHCISISQPQIVRISRNLVCRHKFYPRRRKRDNKIRNSQIQDGGRATYWPSFLAITRLHIVRLSRNVKFEGIIARIRRLGDENVQLRKSNMADGRHFENHYISISQPQIVRISRNLVWRHKLYTGDGNVTNIQKLTNAIWRMASGLKITYHFLAITQLHIVPLRWNMEWGGRITRIRSRSGDQNA